MQKYLEYVKPNVSDVWRTDELYLKVKRDNKYLFAVMDDETRFWIAQQIADKKNSFFPMYHFEVTMFLKRKKTSANTTVEVSKHYPQLFYFHSRSLIKATQPQSNTDSAMLSD